MNVVGDGQYVVKWVTSAVAVATAGTVVFQYRLLPATACKAATRTTGATLLIIKNELKNVVNQKGKGTP